jgi:hypothetical protein
MKVLNLHRLPAAVSIVPVPVSRARVRAKALRNRKKVNFLARSADGADDARVAAIAGPVRRQSQRQELQRVRKLGRARPRQTTSGMTPPDPNQTMPPMNLRRLSPILDKKPEKKREIKSKVIGMFLLVVRGADHGTIDHAARVRRAVLMRLILKPVVPKAAATKHMVSSKKNRSSLVEESKNRLARKTPKTMRPIKR